MNLCISIAAICWSLVAILRLIETLSVFEHYRRWWRARAHNEETAPRWTVEVDEFVAGLKKAREEKKP